MNVPFLFLSFSLSHPRRTVVGGDSTALFVANLRDSGDPDLDSK